MLINYIDLRHKYQNYDTIIAFNNAIIEGKLSLKHFQAIGIVDCSTTWAPSFLIRKYADKANKTKPQLKSILLFDYDGILNQKYGYTDKDDDLTCVVLADKQNICRAIYNNKTTEKQIAKLVSMAVKLQNKPDKPTITSNTANANLQTN